MQNILKTNNLTKNYKMQVAVDNANMTINAGDIYGFVGENGAGKTTIIRMIAGLVNETSGTYELFGTDKNDPNINNVRRKLSAVVESPSLYLNMTAYDNLLMQCKILGINNPDLIKETLEIVNLNYLINNSKKARNFSLGMKQRLGIAIALIGNPDFIILDEPMNGLDPEGIVEMRELIVKLNKEKNITFLISSHILTELSRVATKYGFIHRGKMIKEITAKELAEESRKSLEIKVSSTENVATILEELKITNYKISVDEVKIYQDADINTIVSKFAQAGITIKNIANNDENIEEFYLKLMGGNRHA
ncbi:MAG: ATP-binding cassette domain-containing protein [Erysipelotrichales bacterium]|nr:ATP-binding cassette domain-containing protein [Erysipelotrichales bacterium]